MASSAAAYPPMSGPAGGTSSSPPVSNVVSDIVPAMSSPAVTAPGAAQAHGPAGAPAAAAAASLPPPSRGAAAPQAQPQPSAQTTTHHHALQPQRVAHVPPAVSQAPQPVSSQPQQQHGAAARPAVAANPPGGPSFVGFPSPTIDHAKSKPRFQDDVKRVSYNIQESLPESVRRAIRDNWEKCLLGSDFHQAFVMNATVHHASSSITKRAIRDFGSKMIQDGRLEIIQHFTTQDIDALADVILAKASSRFLDMALEARLRTIEAKPLINALARAERLGYEPGDIVEEDQQHGQERVIPRPDMPVETPGAYQPPPASVTPRPTVPAAAPSPALRCPSCHRYFRERSAWEYHTKRTICKRTPSNPSGFKMSCPHCYQGFTTPVGLQYHHSNKVCGDFSHVPSQGGSSAAPLPQPPAAMVSSGPSSPALGPTNSSTPVRTTTTASQIYPSSTPQYIASTPASVLSTPPVLVSPSIGDPYAHLTPENRAAMEEELKQAEILFGEKMRQAEAIPDPAERRVRLDGLKNSFGTRQSMIRKRYGVRLRERRTKAEIEAQRSRMGVKDLTRSRAANGSESPTSSAGGGAANGQPPATASPRPSGSGWTAANTASGGSGSGQAHDAKRRRVEDGTVSATASPRHDAELARKVSSASQPATVSSQPPQATPSSAQPTQSYTIAGARVEIHEPRGPAKHPAAARDGADAIMEDAPPAGGSKSQPISIADGDGASSETDSDTNDDGIPARLPATVLHSLSPAGQPPVGS